MKGSADPRRRFYRTHFGLKRRDTLTELFMDQLDRCADDSTRKVLLGLYDGKASKGSKGVPGRKASVQSIADHRPRRIPKKTHSHVEPAERVVLLMQLATGKR